jgi:hypothetical protein
MTQNSGIDPQVVDAVYAVRDRFGAEGLRNLIFLARQEVARLEQQQSSEPGDPADTQAWQAFTDRA